MPRTSDEIQTELVEHWLIRRGVPHAIHDYNAKTDVFTRMLPLMAVVFLLGAVATFGDRFTGWGQAGVLVAGIALLFVAIAAVNRFRGRRMFAMPEDIGLLEIIVFIAAAPLLALVFSDDRSTNAGGLVVLNVLVLVLGYLVTSYAVLPMLRWGVIALVRQFRRLAVLLARTLPLLLLFATFLFINAEMWQVAHNIPWEFFAIVIVFLLAAASAFLAFQLPAQVDQVDDFDSWREVCAIVATTDAPIKPDHDLVERRDRPDVDPLSAGERVNIGLLMFFAQFVQMALVSLVIGGFYVGFGLLTVREQTIDQWVEESASDPIGRLADFHLFGEEVLLTWELLAVSGFIAAISALQFAVSLLSDDVYRSAFYDDIENEVREVLAVRALYRDRIAA